MNGQGSSAAIFSAASRKQVVLNVDHDQSPKVRDTVILNLSARARGSVKTDLAVQRMSALTYARRCKACSIACLIFSMLFLSWLE